METTFITIHDLSADALILYTSDSIVDILGYSPEEVVGRPVWEFFHPEEIPIARARHGRGVELDKAALLAYSRIRDRDDRWVGCEVVFTVVYDVLVGCTSIYRRGARSQNRAMAAPVIRKKFSASPRDPRYHMMTHLSPKFEQSLSPDLHQPRAALFLNRYTRSLTIMYATNGLADILGITGEEMRGLSFYYCIEDSCLQDAVRCLESAKANDSLAYLRFRFREPRSDEEYTRGKQLGRENNRLDAQAQSSTDSDDPVGTLRTGTDLESPESDSRESSREHNTYSYETVFGDPELRQSSASSISDSPNIDAMRQSRSPRRAIELEAIVSCSSDGLVVCLQQANPHSSEQMPLSVGQPYDNGLFAAPWASEPVMPNPKPSPEEAQPSGGNRGLLHTSTGIGPNAGQRSFMDSIRDTAIFAWAIIGINGSLADYGRGEPRGEAQPAAGVSVWQPETAQPGESSTQLASGEQVHGYAIPPTIETGNHSTSNSDAYAGPMDMDVQN